MRNKPVIAGILTALLIIALVVFGVKVVFAAVLFLLFAALLAAVTYFIILSICFAIEDVFL